VYQTPAREFELRRVELHASHTYRSEPDQSAEILIATQAPDHAPLLISTTARTLPMRRGNCVFVPFGICYTISATDMAVVYKAGIPLPP
jgi:hypothetical protein